MLGFNKGLPYLVKKYLPPGCTSFSQLSFSLICWPILMAKTSLCNQNGDGYLLKTSVLEAEGSVVNSVKGSGRCVDKFYKARSSFWARGVKRHGGQETEIFVEPRDEQNFSSASTSFHYDGTELSKAWANSGKDSNLYSLASYSSPCRPLV